jgi:hypothetical protein
MKDMTPCFENEFESLKDTTPCFESLKAITKIIDMDLFFRMYLYPVLPSSSFSPVLATVTTNCKECIIRHDNLIL